MDFIYLDCFSGISGDMLVGALLDAGASFERLQDTISGLKIDAKLSCSKQVVKGISCSAFRVESPNAPPLRHLAQIEELIGISPLPSMIKDDSIAVFRRLAEAEAQVHGVDPSRIHFHEVGAVDTVVDIVGTFLCLDELKVEKVYTSPLPWSEGFVDISHGRYPLPAPATANLLRGFPCVLNHAGIELVTPTGAALLTHIASPAGDLPLFIPEVIAYGAGTLTRPDGVPNLLRLIKARFQDQVHSHETVAILETELDDLNPELYSHLYALFVNHPGVLDFFITPVFMKKNRPGSLITILASPDYIRELSSLLMRESGTLGVRYRLQERFCLSRRQEILETLWGPVRIKIAQHEEGPAHMKPEYEDCHQIAVQHGIPLLDVYTVVQGLISNLKA